MKKKTKRPIKAKEIKSFRVTLVLTEDQLCEMLQQWLNAEQTTFIQSKGSNI